MEDEMKGIEKQIVVTETEVSCFKEMVSGADRLIKGWKIALIVTVVFCNLVWGLVFGYAIHKAYQEPTTYEYGQNQDQDGEMQKQSAEGKGGGN